MWAAILLAFRRLLRPIRTVHRILFLMRQIIVLNYLVSLKFDVFFNWMNRLTFSERTRLFYNCICYFQNRIRYFRMQYFQNLFRKFFQLMFLALGHMCYILKKQHYLSKIDWLLFLFSFIFSCARQSKDTHFSVVKQRNTQPQRVDFDSQRNQQPPPSSSSSSRQQQRHLIRTSKSFKRAYNCSIKYLANK